MPLVRVAAGMPESDSRTGVPKHYVIVIYFMSIARVERCGIFFENVVEDGVVPS
jgi:hypothetical protein